MIPGAIVLVGVIAVVAACGWAYGPAGLSLAGFVMVVLGSILGRDRAPFR